MVNYPNGHRPKGRFNRTVRSQKTIRYGGRGMSLEEQLNQSNQYYLANNIAVIHKKPTPIQVVKVDYPRRSAARITEAYYRKASTTDYNGVYQGKYIDFEAKETRNKTSYPLSNFPEHQRVHMQQCINQGGIAFLILYFSRLDEIYLLPYPAIAEYIETQAKQSLSYDFIVDSGYLCPRGAMPTIDYLKALDQYIISLNQKG